MKLNVLNSDKYIKIPRHKQLYKCSLMATEIQRVDQPTVILSAFFTQDEDELEYILQSNKIKGFIYDDLVPLQRVTAIDFQDTLERAEIIFEVI